MSETNQSLCLTHLEIKEITGKLRYSSQASELNRLGIDHQIRSDGSILVFRSQVEKQQPVRKKASPDFGAIKGVA